jgi:EmrB/QacA subfamily drug resistance transporter
MVESTTAKAPSIGLARWQVRTVLTVLLTGQLLSALDQTIVGTALPTMVGELGKLDDFSLVVTSYLVTSTVATAIYGKLADLYGAKPMYISAIAIFVLGSLLVGFSDNVPEMVAFRAVQGLGAGGLVTLAFTISATVVPPRQIGRVQGIVGGMYALASLIGPLIGGTFTQYVSWRWCFFINVPIGVLALVALSLRLKLPAPRREHTVDYSGAFLLVAGIAALLLVMIWGGTRYAWGSPQILGLIALSIVLTVLFVLRESTAREPLVPLRIFRQPSIATAIVITFVIGVATIGAYFFLPLYLQVVRGDGPTRGGLQLLPLMIAVMIGSGGSGWIMSIVGRAKAVIVLGAGIMSVSLLLFSQLDASTPAWRLWAYEVVMGIGMGMVISKLIIVVQNSADRRDIGTVTAQTAFFRLIGSSIGTAAFGAVLTARMRFWQGRLLTEQAIGRLPHGANAVYTDPASIRRIGSTAPQVHAQVVEVFGKSLQTVFLVAFPIMLVAFVLTWFLPDTTLRTGDHAHGAGKSHAQAGGRPDTPETAPS